MRDGKNMAIWLLCMAIIYMLIWSLEIVLHVPDLN